MQEDCNPDNLGEVNYKVLAVSFGFAGYAMTAASDCRDRAAADTANRMLTEALERLAVVIDIPDSFGEKVTGGQLAAVEGAIFEAIAERWGSEAADLFGFAKRSYSGDHSAEQGGPAGGQIYDDVLRTLFKMF